MQGCDQGLSRPYITYKSALAMPMNPRLLRPIARRQAPAPAPTDPYFSNVSLLLHFDGANESNTFTDSSPSAHAIAASNLAQISTSQSKFGGASGLFGDADYLEVPYAAADFGTGDFTVEGWVYLTPGWSDFQTVFSNYASFGANALMLFAGVAGSGLWTISYNGNFPGIQSASSITYSAWTHFAVVRNGSDLTLYINGVNEGSADVTGVGFSGNAPVFYINAAGDNPLGTNCNGHIDEFRITKGVARYTANFTPPTAPFPNQ